MPKTLSGAISAGVQDKISHSAKVRQLHSRRQWSFRSLRLIAALFLVVALQGFPRHASALEPQTGASTLPDLDGAVSILADPSSSLTLSDVLDPARRAQFRPIPGPDVNLGYIHTAVWIRLTLAGLAKTQAILSLTPNFLDYIDVYAAAPGAGLQAERFIRHEMGDHRPPPQDGLSGLDNAVRLDFTEGVSTYVYIRVFNTNSSTHLNLQLRSVEERGRQVAATASAFGIRLGGMGALLVTQFVFFYFDRKTQYPLLAFSTLGIILIYMGNLGYSHVYLFPDNGAANDIFIGFNAWAGLAASALAYSSILDLRNKAPLLYRLYQFTVLVGVVGTAFAFAGRNTLFGPVGTIFSILMSVINMVEGLRQMKHGGSAGRLRAAAFTVLCAGASLSMIQRLGYVWMPHWTVHSYGIASFILTILLTGSLAVRLRDAEALNSRMREEALQTAQEAEQIANRLVEERTRELVVARRAAEDALLAEKQSQLQQVRFLEVISHQYRTPLAAIRSSVDSIGLGLAPDDGSNRGRIERIRRAIARLVEMLEINLARSRLQGPSFRPQIVRINASSVVSSAFQRARDLLNGPEIRLSIHPSGTAASVMADAGMLELALVNLLENAVKYTALKGNAPVDLLLTMHGAEIVIDVADRGIGIPSGDLPNIFAHATRGSNAESVEGSGLGLFLVDKIIKAHNGRVLAESKEGEGTTVRIILQAAV
jgi:signal transduction histidine kinase